MLDAFNGQLTRARFLVGVTDQVIERLLGTLRPIAIAVVLPAALQAAPLPTASAGQQFYICTVVTGQAGLQEMECGAPVRVDILPEQLGELGQESSTKFQARLAVEQVPRLDMAKKSGEAPAQDHKQDVAQAGKNFNNHKNALDVFWLVLGAFIGLFALHTGLVDEISDWFNDRLDSLLKRLKK